MATTDLNHAGLDILDGVECFELLRSAHLGRVALSLGALPAVFPVHFALLGRDPVFRTEPGAKLTVAAAGNVVCLEIDHSDPEFHTGWSVMAIGPAEVLTDGPTLEAARCLPLDPWVGSGDAYVRIISSIVTGRRVGGAARNGTQRAPRATTGRSAG